MYTTMSNFPYLPHYLLPTSMIIISCVNFFDLSILTFQCSTISCQKWFFRGISWQRCCHCYPFCAALGVGHPCRWRSCWCWSSIHMFWRFRLCWCMLWMCRQCRKGFCMCRCFGVSMVIKGVIHWTDKIEPICISYLNAYCIICIAEIYNVMFWWATYLI